MVTGKRTQLEDVSSAHCVGSPLPFDVFLSLSQIVGDVIVTTIFSSEENGTTLTREESHHG